RCWFGGTLKRPCGRRLGSGFFEETAGALVEPQQVLHLFAKLGPPGAGLVQVGPAQRRVFLLQGRDEDVSLGHGSPAPRGCCPSVRNPSADRANFFAARTWPTPGGRRSPGSGAARRGAYAQRESALRAQGTTASEAIPDRRGCREWRPSF